jgi:hypothetical protein
MSSELRARKPTGANGKPISRSQWKDGFGEDSGPFPGRPVYRRFPPIFGTLHYRNPADGGHAREGLVKAGLPDEPQTLEQCADRTSQRRKQRPLPRAWRTGQIALVLLFLVGSVQERMRQVRSFMYQRSCITADVDGRTESDRSDGHAPR